MSNQEIKAIRTLRNVDLDMARQEAIDAERITLAWEMPDGRQVLSVHGAGPNGGALIAVSFPDSCRIIYGEQDGQETTAETVARLCSYPVTVRITDPDHYAEHWGKTFDGRSGRVVKTKDQSVNGRNSMGPAALVEFDQPVTVPERSIAEPIREFWFPLEDLIRP